MKKLEYYEHNIVEDWYSDVYIIESGKMIKAPLIEMNGEELIKLNYEETDPNSKSNKKKKKKDKKSKNEN